MIDTYEHIEHLEEEDFITIIGIVTKSYFEELMDGRESFHDVEWDIQEYDEWDIQEDDTDAIDTSKYEGHDNWEGTKVNMANEANKLLIADAPLLLAEVKRLRESEILKVIE